MLSGCLVAHGHEEKGEAAEEEHDTVHEAFDEITQHLVGISVRATCGNPQFSGTFVLGHEMSVRVACEGVQRAAAS